MAMWRGEATGGLIRANPEVVPLHYPGILIEEWVSDEEDDIQELKDGEIPPETQAAEGVANPRPGGEWNGTSF